VTRSDKAKTGNNSRADRLVLYALPQSPYCAKVRAVLRFKGIAFTEEEPAGGSYQTTEYQELVAAGSIPAIHIGDWVLHDSQAILEYLEETWPEPAIWNVDARIRASQRALMHYHDTRLEPAARELVGHARQPDSPERAHQLDLIQDRLFDRLYRLDRMVHPAPWMGGASPCAVDWAYAPTLAIAMEMLAAVGRELELPPDLMAWFGRVSVTEPVATELCRAREAVRTWLEQDMAGESIH
jgi:glutathione S-transferase